MAIDFHECFQDHDRVTRAIARGARDAAIRHKALGVPIAIWKDNQVTIVPPEEIEIPDLPVLPSDRERPGPESE